MNRILEKANKQIEEKIGVEAVEYGSSAYEKKEDIFEKYERMKEVGEVFSVQFESCGRDGTFVGADPETGVLYVMRGAVTLAHFDYFKPHLTARMLGYKFDVKVVEIDRLNKRIYLESSHEIRTHSSKHQIISALLRELDAGNTPKVWGRVQSVQGKKAYIDILGENVLGIISIYHWQKTYLRFLSTVCRPGEYYPFYVTQAAPKKPGKTQAFYLDHTELAENPWDSVPDDVVKVGAVIYVKCIEVPKGKPYWWGCSAIAPGIEIMGRFPSEEGKLTIIPELTYKCKIRQIARADEPDNADASNQKRNENLFVVVPFDVAEVDSMRYAKFLTLRETKLSAGQIPDCDDGEEV